MAPSTVLSYLRRDHRRPTSPTAHSPSPQSPVVPSDSQPHPHRISNPPQLPAAPHTPTLTDSLLGSGIWGGAVQEPRHQPMTGVVTAEPPTREDTKSDVAATSSASQPARIPSRSHSSDDAESGRSVTAGSTLVAPAHHEKSTSPLKVEDNHVADLGKASALGGRGNPHAYEMVVASPGLEVRKTSVDGQSPLSASSARREREYYHEEATVPPPQSRTGKTKLNLLNPLHLLARRRQGQPSTSRPDDLRVNRRELPALPDDYDPRIRGKHVHDFSVPRPRSHVSASNYHWQSFTEPNDQDQATLGVDAENDSASAISRVRSGGQSDDGRKMSQEMPQDAARQDARVDLPVDNESQHGSRQQADEGPSAEVAPVSEGKQQEQSTSIPSSTEGTAAAASNTPSRSSTAGRSSLPKHLRSSASRFSFDMAGVESASQEKLLEEKHKEKEAARRANVQRSYFDDESDSDDIDYEAMLDDGGLEEGIPGVNVDLEEQDDLEEDGIGNGVPSHAHPLKPMPLKQFVPALSPLVSNPASPLTLHSPSQPPEGRVSPGRENSIASSGHAIGSPETSSNTVDVTVPPPLQPTPGATAHKRVANSQILSDDDFYFDDGMFDDDDVPVDESEVFDESIFDDESSHLYARKNKTDNEKPLPNLADGSLSEKLEKIEQQDRSLPCQDSVSSGNDISGGGVDDIDNNCGHGHPANDDQELHAGEDLTEGNLQAYHSALAQAAHQAALKGRFDRRVSASEASIENESAPATGDSQPDLTADQSRVSQSMEQVALVEDDALDDFDYDDAHGMDEDDAIIAAANAEVLEYDDEEFYGQEFGFYAHSPGDCEGEPVYGGYFGSRGLEGVNRSHSGRAANFREPSLTPITERSEWSTRNSIISLAAQQTGHSNPSLSSPAQLAQLVDRGNIEDEMSLSALMKLRRGAFGGSNGSLRSSAASPTSTSPTTGPAQHQVGSLNGTTAASFYEAMGGGEFPRSKSAMSNSSPSGMMVAAAAGPADSNGSFQGQSSVDSSPDLPLQSDGPVREKVVVPPPLSVDTARANASSP